MRRVFPHWGQDDLFPGLNEFQRDFRKKFDRDMTPEETRLYLLTKDMLENSGFVERRKLQLPVKTERRNSDTELFKKGAA